MRIDSSTASSMCLATGPSGVDMANFSEDASIALSMIKIVALYSVSPPGGIPYPVTIRPVSEFIASTGRKSSTSKLATHIGLGSCVLDIAARSLISGINTQASSNNKRTMVAIRRTFNSILNTLLRENTFSLIIVHNPVDCISPTSPWIQMQLWHSCTIRGRITTAKPFLLHVKLH